ncbi:Phosducin-like protein 2 [Lobosporangium transversale]|uniref:Phosducin-domain-containing protein n=1 Tax=Lobosporangium transversale TaxID=64571 RepID=A0A1Y2GHP6_9FUNG|nr:Phosducin-domain-containing protein [Lobosporangium transversale]KAF9915868.1 Phosducin-like protein 2 [Lobosporangium transversale]ORZ09991.1 Phosducin-domain-containing protein [Lobosporangium transversale]|eukprot:XP_021879081.1 Phosducin-domain-containing protein [Lobosporangium transversale]
MEEAKRMGLDIEPDPETNSNAPRDHRAETRAQYLYDNNDPEDWGSTASESEESESELRFTRPKDDYNNNDDLETGGLTDGEIDRIDGKTSSRIGSSARTGGKGGAGVGAGANKYPERDTGANTGPKGVIADQKYHHQQQLQKRLSSQQSYNARMLSKAPMTTTYRQDKERERQEKKAQGLLDEDEEDEDEKALRELEEEDQDEKAVLERIRGSRLQDMSWAAKADKSGTGASSVRKKRVFGSLMEMNAAQYVNAIDMESKDVTVVIHIYSEYNPACKKLDGCLIQLAARYATTKFIRIKAREVDFDEEVSPTVLAYRAGDLIANLVMITHELSEDFDDSELEDLFTKYKIFSPHDQYQRESSFFESSLDSPVFSMSSMSSQFEDLNMMSKLSSGSGNESRRGILSGDIKEYGYKAYEARDSDEDDAYTHRV